MPPPSSSDAEPGTRIGHYEIQHKLGAGAMGEVYAATDLQLGRTVAIKLLPGDVAADDERRQRLQREAKAIAALNHPNIVVLYSVEEADGRLFLTMELVRGRPLSELLPGEGLPLDDFFRWAIPLVDALGAAHQQGVTHRDLKPQNVMVGEEGRLKILDFGLAQIQQGSPGVTEADMLQSTVTALGTILGTVAYMSPEQAQGQRVDHRSDIFAVGVMLYEMACGQRPFQAPSALLLLTAIIRDIPPPVTERNPGVPHRLAAILRRCLEKEPGRRYQSALDLRHDLEELQQELRSGEGRAAPAAASAPVPPRRRWALSAVAAAAIALLLGTGIVRFLQKAAPASASPPPPSGPVIAHLIQLTGDQGAELQPSLSPDGTWFVYASRTSNGSWDLFRQRVGGENPQPLTPDSPDDDTQPAISPDGERIAFRSSRLGGGIFVMGATGESVKRLTDFGYSPSWTPDGRALVVSTDATDDPRRRKTLSEAWLVDATTGERLRRLSHGDAAGAVVSPHGLRVAWWGIHQGGVRDLWTAPLDGGEPLAVTDDAALDWGPQWSPDGRYLYFSSDRAGSPNLFRVPIDEASGRTLGPPEPVTVGAGAWSHSPSFSRDGSKMVMVVGGPIDRIERIRFDPVRELPSGPSTRLALGDYPSVGEGGLLFHTLTPNDDIVVAREDGSGRRRLTEDSPHDRAARFSPDGMRIAFQSDRAGSYDLWTIRPDGSGLERLTEQGNTMCPVWSPDGQQMSAYEVNVGSLLFDPRRPWSEQKPSPLPPLPLPGFVFFAYDWSRDGRLLVGPAVASSGAYGGIWLYELATGKYRQVAPRGEEPVVFLSDSRRILYILNDEVVLTDTVSGRSHMVLSYRPDVVQSGLSISRDDRWLYYSRRSLEGDLWMAILQRTP